MTDLINRADAVSTVIKWASGEGGDIVDLIESLPSAARPMVIKCESFLSEEDFKAVAEQVRDLNVMLISSEAVDISTNTSTNISTKPTNISTNTSVEAPQAEQVTSKLNNRDDSLLTDDTAERKESGSKLEPLPSASVEVGEWIPVSERLPEVHPYKDVTGMTWDESDDVLICMNYGNMHVATYEVDSETRRYWVDKDGLEYTGVIAWMPLPKPYEGGDEE